MRSAREARSEKRKEKCAEKSMERRLRKEFVKIGKVKLLWFCGGIGASERDWSWHRRTF
jgi:hypothetical protein